MKQSILFVDDDPAVLRAIERSLHRDVERWTMVFACGAEHALAALQRMRFDAIVSDARMPGTDGPRLLGFIRERHPAMRRIVLSGNVDDAGIREVREVAHLLLQKPCPIRDLRQALETQLACA